MPFNISEYTDFYSCSNHALNASKIIRGEDASLSQNWYNLPVAYNGRKSSVCISETNIPRPKGQIVNKDTGILKFESTKKLDFELELGTVLGTNLEFGKTSNFRESEDLIFGFVLLNDWSARDIQSWEYQPLGPFLSKSFGTTISPWIVTPEALKDFIVPPPKRKIPLLSHFEDEHAYVYDIDLMANLIEQDGIDTVITKTNARELYYSPVQQILHHASSGSGMSAGDLLGSGTISGIDKDSRGCLLELTWGGTDPITLKSGKKRSFLKDNDTIVLKGVSVSENYSIGFGQCIGKIIT
jgi:fumarylacetoacetase